MIQTGLHVSYSLFLISYLKLEFSFINLTLTKGNIQKHHGCKTQHSANG